MAVRLVPAQAEGAGPSGGIEQREDGRQVSAADDDYIVAVAANQDIRASAAQDTVIAGPAMDEIGTTRADQRVITATGNDRFEFGEAFAAEVGEAGLQIDQIIAGKGACIQRIIAAAAESARPTRPLASSALMRDTTASAAASICWTVRVMAFLFSLLVSGRRLGRVAYVMEGRAAFRAH